VRNSQVSKQRPQALLNSLTWVIKRQDFAQILQNLGHPGECRPCIFAGIKAAVQEPLQIPKLTLA